MRTRELFLTAALAASAWTPALAQSTPPSTPRFGIIGGANLATFSAGFFSKVSNRTGFAGGLIAVLPVTASFAVQPELMFTRKGANADSGGFSSTAKIDYIELPVLARFALPVSGRLKPFVYGGPGFAYRTSCTLEGHTDPGAINFVDPMAITIGCDALARQAAQAVPGAKFSRTDVDGIIGGGLAFDVGGRTVSVSVRYDVGFVKLISYTDDKNRVLSFMGTVEWPFHK
jgi:hypothetical protein